MVFGFASIFVNNTMHNIIAYNCIGQSRTSNKLTLQHKQQNLNFIQDKKVKPTGCCFLFIFNHALNDGLLIHIVGVMLCDVTLFRWVVKVRQFGWLPFDYIFIDPTETMSHPSNPILIHAT